MKKRHLVVAMGLVLALALAMPVAADDGLSVESLWNELVEWMVDLVTVEPATVQSPDAPPDPDDELLSNVDPNG
ncbi:MAG: hypothetical protein AAGD06_28530 [Acidobacteriota bacterium]